MGTLANLATDNRRAGRRPVGRVAETILREVWSIYLRRSGFEDLEAEHNVISKRGQPTSFFRGRHVPGEVSMRGDRHLSTDADDGSGRFEHMADIAAYYRRMEQMSVRFEDAVDQQIAGALSDGVYVRHIKARLRVGQTRIERVAKQLRLWMREKPEDDRGEE